MNRWGVWGVLLAFAGALLLRLPALGTRPLHNDEAVNAVKVTALWERGEYAYDPDEYHGPLLHYASLPFFRWSGARNSFDLDDARLRLAPVAFGAGLILLLPLFASGLGARAIVWAALFIAISPAMVFYSRYFIHEMPLVFFTALALGAGWRHVQTPSLLWAALTGAGIGLMFVTKETFVLTLGAAGLAVIATACWVRVSPTVAVGVSPAVEPGLPARRKEACDLAKAADTPLIRTAGRAPSTAGETPAATAGSRDGGALDLGGQNANPLSVESLLKLWNRRFNACHAAVALGVASLIWLVFFSSFFTHGAGLLDSFRTYLPWLKRAGGHSPHIHPWYFYLQRLAWFHPAKGPAWSEALILALAVVGAGAALRRGKPPLPFFLVLYTLLLTAIYSTISYKTPWCLLSFYLGLILLAGLGAAAVAEFFSKKMSRAIAVAVLVALAAQLAWQAWRASFVFSADRRNPWVYAQTAPGVLELKARADGIARVAADGYGTVVKIMAPGSDYWPLPWYLRRFKNVGFYEQVPDDPFSPIVITSSKLDARLDEKSGKKWIMAGLFELRPRNGLELYVELELWKKYVETLPRDQE